MGGNAGRLPASFTASSDVVKGDAAMWTGIKPGQRHLKIGGPVNTNDTPTQFTNAKPETREEIPPQGYVIVREHDIAREAALTVFIAAARALRDAYEWMARGKTAGASLVLQKFDAADAALKEPR